MGTQGALRRSTRAGLRSLKSFTSASAEISVKSEYTSKYFPASDGVSDIIVKEEKENVELKKEENDFIPTDFSVSKKRKTVKHENVELEILVLPPKNFEKIYGEVKEMRSKIITPVDTMGCAFLPERISGKKSGPVFRYQLLVCLMLSAQTKDEVNALVMQNLQETMLAKGFEDGLCVDAIIATPEEELDKLIFKVGFHTRKLKFIKLTTEIVKLKYNSDIPKTIEELTSFPGVGPKMGYLLLQSAWDITTGLGVDVHIFRLANMWNWVPKVKNPTPENTRLALERWLPRELWKEFNPVIVGFGQSICLPRGRRCDLCTLSEFGNLCPNVDRALLKKVKLKTDKRSPPRKVRGDLSGIIKVQDIEDLV